MNSFAGTRTLFGLCASPWRPWRWTGGPHSGCSEGGTRCGSTYRSFGLKDLRVCMDLGERRRFGVHGSRGARRMDHGDGDPGPAHPASSKTSQSISRDERSQQWYSSGAESSRTRKYPDKEIAGANLPSLLIRQEQDICFALWRIPYGAKLGSPQPHQKDTVWNIPLKKTQTPTCVISAFLPWVLKKKKKS